MGMFLSFTLLLPQHSSLVLLLLQWSNLHQVALENSCSHGISNGIKNQKILMGCRQAVRHRTLTPAFVGSNPTISAQTLSFVNHLLRTSDKTSEVLFFNSFLNHAIYVFFYAYQKRKPRETLRLQKTYHKEKKSLMTCNNYTCTYESCSCYAEGGTCAYETPYQHQESDNEEFFECQNLYEEGMWC